MSTPSKTPVTDAAKYDSQPGNPMCPGGIMVVHAEVAEKLERERKDFQKGMFSACSGYIGATEVAGKAIVAMEQALKAGIAHSRRRMEESLPRLREELKQCRLDHQGPVHINSNVRLFDLVRFMRSELHKAELITDEEYSWLCAEADLATAPEGGSPSPRRLEDYDAMRQRIEILLQAIETAKAKVESDSIVASCDCNAKTNDPQHHAKGCKYRLICERDTAREKIDAISKRAEAIRCELVVSEKKLTEKDAIIHDLRTAASYAVTHHNADGEGAITLLEKALSAPAPAVVPLEDVTPLLDALLAIEAHSISTKSRADAGKAANDFTAKHPL